MSQSLKEQFLAIARNEIKRPGIDELIKYLEKSDFFEAPASTKYHGCYSGGLVQHCIDVFNCLHDELAFIYGDNYEAKYSGETIAIVSLFHDLCKIGRYNAGTRNVKDPVTKQWHEEPTYFYNTEAFELGHGAQSMYTVMKYVQLTDEEAQAIYWHMGAYDISAYSNLNGLGSAYERNGLAFALHRADMMATYVVDNKHFDEAPLPEATEEEHTSRASKPDAAEEKTPAVKTPDDADDEFNPADYEDWSIEDLKAEIEEWGGEPKKRAKKSELIKQLGALMQEPDEELPFR